MRKIIFLDVDGVLNCAGTRHKRRGTLGIDSVLAERFKRLVARTGAEVVLSSTWRLDESTRQQVIDAGIKFLSVTPNFTYALRGEEIDTWLQHKGHNVDIYAIIDDDADMLPWQPLFKTTWAEGLTDEIATRIEHHLNSV